MDVTIPEMSGQVSPNSVLPLAALSACLHGVSGPAGGSRLLLRYIVTGKAQQPPGRYRDIPSLIMRRRQTENQQISFYLVSLQIVVGSHRCSLCLYLSVLSVYWSSNMSDQAKLATNIERYQLIKCWRSKYSKYSWIVTHPLLLSILIPLVEFSYVSGW